MRIIEAVSKAVPELGNLLDASKLLTSEPDSTTHAHGDKVIGWRKYRTVFEVGGMFIEGTTNIQITQHGDVYYGMSKLKDITNSPTVQAYLSGGDRTNGDVLNLTIAQPDDSVKFSLRPTDTPQFKRWFKGSKVVNDDGSPKVVYHGSPNDFSVFDLSYLGTNGTAEGSSENLPIISCCQLSLQRD